ncbi:hypothetical protein BCT20_02205 [Vibrio sp. 10N.222.55.C12]|nr:hypothetical protein BCT20_02205 [Vibrio sp. 10N.222.55.C12]
MDSIYLAMYFLLLSLCFLDVPFNKNSSTKFGIFVLSFVILFFPSGLRYDVGNDYFSYLDIFSKISEGNNVETIYMEPLFKYLVYALRFFFEAETVFIFLAFSSLLMIAVVPIVFKTRFVSLFYILYFGMLYFSFQNNVIRHGLACGFIWLAIYFFSERRNVSFFLCIILGSGMHAITMAFLPIIFLANKKIERITYFKVLLLSFLAYKLKFVTFVFSLLPSDGIFYKLYYYSQVFYSSSELSTGFSAGFLLWFVIFLFFVIKRDFFETCISKFRILLNLMFVSLVLQIIFHDVPIFYERISSILNVANILLLSSVIFSKSDKKYYLVLFIFIPIYALLLLQVNLLSRGINGKALQYLPYNSIGIF